MRVKSSRMMSTTDASNMCCESRSKKQNCIRQKSKQPVVSLNRRHLCHCLSYVSLFQRRDPRPTRLFAPSVANRFATISGHARESPLLFRRERKEKDFARRCFITKNKWLYIGSAPLTLFNFDRRPFFFSISSWPVIKCAVYKMPTGYIPRGFRRVEKSRNETTLANLHFHYSTTVERVNSK